MIALRNLSLGIAVSLTACGTVNDQQPDQDIEKNRFEDMETRQQSDYQVADDHGQPFEPDAPVPFDQQFQVFSEYQTQQNGYGTTQGGMNYDVRAEGYDQQLSRHIEAFRRPYGHYASISNRYDGRNQARPYLMDRYRTHRSFLNYVPSFNRLDDRQGRMGWQSGERRHYGQSFDRSRRWVNYDLYNLIYRTLNTMQSCGYRSEQGLEDRIRRAIRDRDHRQAAYLHDELLRSSQGRAGQAKYRNSKGAPSGSSPWGDYRNGDSKRGFPQSSTFPGEGRRR